MTHRSVSELTPKEVAALLDAGEILLIDVREPTEYAAERIHGALLYPLSTFDATKVPSDREHRVVFHCGSGKRSLMAAHKCLAAGRPHAAHMAGGIAEWKAEGLACIRIDDATGRVIDAPSR